WNHSDPIPNSEVKRCCGDDSLRVASCYNSSMPGLFLKQKAAPINKGAAFCLWQFFNSPNHTNSNNICDTSKYSIGHGSASAPTICRILFSNWYHF
ncbi:MULTISPECIES: hypothetical protein, partial [unclassified Calothrix]|uniref:hypothetical protein n=1 Tax=unclassified Calothrix TaxID=2619626 RepID=UPI001A7EF6E1